MIHMIYALVIGDGLLVASAHADITHVSLRITSTTAYTPNDSIGKASCLALARSYFQPRLQAVDLDSQDCPRRGGGGGQTLTCGSCVQGVLIIIITTLPRH